MLFFSLLLNCAIYFLHCEADRFYPRDLIFSDDYSIYYGPETNDGTPLQVNVSIHLSNIFEVNEISSYVTIETTLRMEWYDSRIRPKKNVSTWNTEFLAYFGDSIKEYFWMPDLFLDGVLDSRIPKCHYQPSFLRYYRDHKIRLSARFNFDSFCPMDFRKYPNDEQKCYIRFSSWDTTNDALRLAWDLEKSTLNNNITLEKFIAEIYYEKELHWTEKKKYSGLSIVIHLQRQISYHLIQTFIPSILCVVLGWMSLFFDYEAIPGRVKMLMLTLLTTLGMFNTVRESTPRVSYVSYLDIWMVMCLLFIFSILIEFSMVIWMIRHGRKKAAATLETVWIAVFPIVFISFMIIYWCSLLYNDKIFDS